MKTCLFHLPDHKQEELQELTEIIVEKVPAEMVILFGSHARGDWVEDFQDTYEYVSDFDIKRQKDIMLPSSSFSLITSQKSTTLRS